VRIEVRFDPSSPPVVVQGSLVLVGALLHAIESAVESMPDGGEIRIRTGREDGHAVISVEDAGTAPARDADAARMARFSVKQRSVALSLVQSNCAT
jgi:signal transduction histidine kinase